MALRSDTFDLAGLHLTSGEGRRLELAVTIEPLMFGGERYRVMPALIPVRLDISRMTGDGYALRLRFEAQLDGPCMRCLKEAAPSLAVDAHEISQPGRGGEGGGDGDDDLVSPYVHQGELDLSAWARDALVLALPAQIVCRPDCPGLCAICGADLNEAGPDHAHEPEPDPRWAKLSELHFE